MLFLQPKTSIVLSKSSALMPGVTYKVLQVTKDTMQLRATVDSTLATDTVGEIFNVPVHLLPFFTEK